jgi:hypothetical protein
VRYNGPRESIAIVAEKRAIDSVFVPRWRKSSITMGEGHEIVLERAFLGAVAATGGSGQSHIWAANEGATYSPNGTTTHFERGKVSRGLVEPEPAPIVLAEARKPAKRSAAGAASAAFDDVIGTRSGPCDPQYRFGVRIINGNITYEGGGAANAQGRVSPSGTVTVSVSSGPQAANGQGRLTRDYGTGTWRGQGPGGVCSGAWQAWRQ